MNKQQKFNIKIIIMCFLISYGTLIATIPLHEACHWIMSDIDPYSEPIEFHLFDESFQNEIFFASVGYVTIRESYPGSFDDRPAWIDPFQELLCISIQILITFIVILKMIPLLIKKYPNMIKTPTEI